MRVGTGRVVGRCMAAQSVAPCCRSPGPQMALAAHTSGGTWTLHSGQPCVATWCIGLPCCAVTIDEFVVIGGQGQAVGRHACCMKQSCLPHSQEYQGDVCIREAILVHQWQVFSCHLGQSWPAVQLPIICGAKLLFAGLAGAPLPGSSLAISVSDSWLGQVCWRYSCQPFFCKHHTCLSSTQYQQTTPHLNGPDIKFAGLPVCSVGFKM